MNHSISTHRGCQLGACLAVIAGLAGCASSTRYVYEPDTTNVNAAGWPASRTPIPQERPQGAIEIMSYGATHLNRDNQQIPSLHVRAVITNDGDSTPWTFDTAQQMIEIPGEGRSRAMFVNSDIGTVPLVTIGQHERRVLDFYFPLPDTVRDESRLPQFDLLWQVTTPARTVASRTSFERVDRAPDVGDRSEAAVWPLWAAGYGSYWWYNPVYPSVVFVHHHPYGFHGAGRIRVGHFGGRFRAGGTGRVALRSYH